jgi:hypothetical protein
MRSKYLLNGSDTIMLCLRKFTCWANKIYRSKYLLSGRDTINGVNLKSFLGGRIGSRLRKNLNFFLRKFPNYLSFIF